MQLHWAYNFKLCYREFQRLAVQLLDICFITDEPLASKLLTYELKNWGRTTNLSLAVSSEHIQFVAHSCNQELLTDIWSGVMTFRAQKSLKVSVVISYFVKCCVLWTAHVSFNKFFILQRYRNCISTNMKAHWKCEYTFLMFCTRA